MKNDKELFETFKMFLEANQNPESFLDSLHLDLTNIGVDYAVIGGLALSPHNYKRMTVDIDIMVSKATLHNLKQLHGLGYSLRPGSDKNMVIHTLARKIPLDVLVEGQLENGIELPNPKQFRQKINGIWYASLSGLIHLKLIASRTNDISDIHKLIEENYLDIDYYQQLPKSTQEKFKELFDK